MRFLAAIYGVMELLALSAELPHYCCAKLLGLIGYALRLCQRLEATLCGGQRGRRLRGRGLNGRAVVGEQALTPLVAASCTAKHC